MSEEEKQCRCECCCCLDAESVSAFAALLRKLADALEKRQ